MNKEKKRKYIFAQLNSLPNAFQYVEVTNYIKSLEQENKELHNKIDKAIEYIEKCSLGEDYYGNPVMLAKEDEGKDLLEILKDSDVDE